MEPHRIENLDDPRVAVNAPVRIPTAPGVESINVVAALAIALHAPGARA